MALCFSFQQISKEIGINNNENKTRFQKCVRGSFSQYVDVSVGMVTSANKLALCQRLSNI